MIVTASRDYHNNTGAQNNFSQQVEELGSSVTDSIGSVDLQHSVRDDRQPGVTAPAKTQGQSPVSEESRLPHVASKVQEWLRGQKRELVLELPAQVLN